jgi:hypothetical protein
MQRWGPWFAAIVLLGWAVGHHVSPAAASVVEALELEDLVREADEIVVAEVTASRSRWDGRRIVTDVTLSVAECPKGATPPGSTVVLTHLGGQVGDVGMRVEGMPRMVVHGRVLVFARRAPRGGRLWPVGLSQGVLRVDRRAGRDEVHPGGHGMALVRRGAGGRLLAAPGALLHPRPLAEVLRDIRRLVREGRTQ